MPTKFDHEGFKGELYFLDGDEPKKLCTVPDIQEIQEAAPARLCADRPQRPFAGQGGSFRAG